ncbi:rhodanese-like domain-containing protein [Achromobacter sp. F4_2707]|uniref:sulfurtransferase n=1 Tax=Achromobacter sp. F4_2707 TaxID=3114286 RepID=UPI0039C6F38C
MNEIDHDALVVSPQWLAARLGKPGVRIVDCSTWMQPNPVGASTMTSARSHWAQAHLPGSVHWDLVEDFSAQEACYPFTRPAASELAALLSRSGIAPDDHLVLYGARHPNIVTRAWWVLHSMGVERVSVLDGGLEYWQQLGLPLDAVEVSWPATNWGPEDFTPACLADAAAVQRALNGEAVLVNALSAAQFVGDPNSPHYGRPGRIPGSLSLPAGAMHEEGRFLAPAAVREAAIAAGVPEDPNTPIITYCGGGLAASNTYLCLLRAGWVNLSLYDNSLLEWSANPDLPMTC